MQLAIAIATALASSLLLGRLAIIAASRLRFLDRPGERKAQAAPVPLMGGLAIYLGTLAGTLVQDTQLEADSFLPRWLLAGAVLLGVGLLDDRRGLGPRLRLLAQTLVALCFWPELVAWLTPAWLGVALGLAWLVGLVNSLNFLDNMDAAAAGSAVWTVLLLAGALQLSGDGAVGFWPLAAALAGFLWWNRPPARLYMGDAGSTFLGLSLGLFALITVTRTGMDPWLAPLFLAVPIYDTCTVFWIRLRERRPLWVGDRRHVTHRMAARGASVTRTVLTLNLWTLAVGGLALVGLARGWNGALLLGGAFVVGVLVFGWERGREKPEP